MHGLRLASTLTCPSCLRSVKPFVQRSRADPWDPERTKFRVLCPICEHTWEGHAEQLRGDA